jgi:hypothetical protein
MLMFTDLLAVAGLVALVLGWLAAQRLAARHGSPESEAFRCGACSGDCGGSRPDCPGLRFSPRPKTGEADPAPAPEATVPGRGEPR